MSLLNQAALLLTQYEQNEADLYDVLRMRSVWDPV